MGNDNSAERHCQLCELLYGVRVVAEVDGRIQGGPWADMCPTCHTLYGVGFGVGRGQWLRRAAQEVAS